MASKRSACDSVVVVMAVLVRPILGCFDSFVIDVAVEAAAPVAGNDCG